MSRYFPYFLNVYPLISAADIAGENFNKTVDTEHKFAYNLNRTLVPMSVVCEVMHMYVKKRRKRYVIKSRARLYLSVIILFLLVAGVLYAAKAYSLAENTYISIQVMPGDTLWSIASKYNTGRDIRKFIFDIKEINGLTDSTIYEGQRLIIPEPGR